MLSQLVGAVEGRRLYETWAFNSTRAWAESELGLSHDDCLDHLRLWSLMIAAEASDPGVPFEVWLTITKGKAMLVARGHRASIPIPELVGAALAADTEDDLREWIARRTGAELPWVTVEFSAPPAVAELFESALILALREVEGIEVPPDITRARAMTSSREVRFRTVEVLCVSYVQDMRTP